MSSGVVAAADTQNVSETNISCFTAQFVDSFRLGAVPCGREYNDVTLVTAILLRR